MCGWLRHIKHLFIFRKRSCFGLKYLLLVSQSQLETCVFVKSNCFLWHYPSRKYSDGLLEKTHVWCLQSHWKHSYEKKQNGFPICWSWRVAWSLADISLWWQTTYHPLNLLMAKSDHILRNFRNVDMICMKRTNVTYLWFAQMYWTTLTPHKHAGNAICSSAINFMLFLLLS